MADTKLNLKLVTLTLLVDKERQRVLFAEADKDFIDFLFGLLVLPVGTVIRILDKPSMLSGLTKLYQSINDLSNDYLQSNLEKDVLLNPKSALPLFTNNVLLPSETFSAASLAQPTVYKCGNCKTGNTITSTNTQTCGYCKGHMNTVDDRYVMKNSVDAKEGGFVKGLVRYMVMDDLAVSPISTISKINLLNKLNIKDSGLLEEKIVHIGKDEGLKLLKHSMSSKTVLTDLFLGDVVGIDGKRKRSKSEGN